MCSSDLNSIDRLNKYVFDSSKLFRLTDIGQIFINNINNAAGRSGIRSEYYDVKFYNAYPTSVASMPATWGDEGFHRLTVTWAYEYFTINEQ